MGGFFSLLVTPAALVDLGDVEIGFAISRIAVELGFQNLDGFVGLAVFAEQEGMARSNRWIGRIFRERFLAGLQGLWQIFRSAVCIHDQHARAPILFLAEMP